MSTMTTCHGIFYNFSPRAKLMMTNVEIEHGKMLVLMDFVHFLWWDDCGWNWAEMGLCESHLSISWMFLPLSCLNLFMYFQSWDIFNGYFTLILREYSTRNESWVAPINVFIKKYFLSQEMNSSFISNCFCWNQPFSNSSTTLYLHCSTTRWISKSSESFLSERSASTATTFHLFLHSWSTL